MTLRRSGVDVMRRSSHESAAARSAGATSVPHAAAFIVIAISGMCALGGEVIWTRLLAMMMGATVYTFSIILAVFLIGLGLGSSAGALVARTSRRGLRATLPSPTTRTRLPVRRTTLTSPTRTTATRA